MDPDRLSLRQELVALAAFVAVPLAGMLLISWLVR